MTSRACALLVSAFFLLGLTIDGAGQADQDRPPHWLSRFGAKWVTKEVAGHEAFVLLPEKPRSEPAKPWVWYAPIFTGQNPDQSNVWLFRRLLDEGFAIAGVDVGESYGNPEGRKIYTAFYNILVNTRGYSPKPCLLAQSRGGLMAYNWAAEHPQSVQCIGGIYPVCDLRSYPGLARASAAYGMTAEELSNHLAEHNPIDRLQGLAEAGVPILHLHGGADKVVPLETNSLELAKRYRALGGKIELEIVPGKGHAEIPEFFESECLLRFFVSVGGSRESAPLHRR